MNFWAVLMVVAGGLFAGGAVSFAWSRVPIWRRMAREEYVRDFGETIRRTDKVQPFLAGLAIVSAAMYALGTTGLAQVLAVAGALGFIAIIVASFAVLVPLQRRIVAVGPASADLAEMHARWDQGNLGRSVLALTAFAAVAAAAASAGF